ncbi:serine hydrolase domain-containing protein [Paracoccus pacificus]|uniref:Serine hydrolase domain-containing protein n=1 Tax=Paracoccus pacificus TaxID=1463598 RepID=A0ABW4R662_9RHOB
MTNGRGIISCRITGPEPKAARGDGAPVFPYWSFTKTVIAICVLRLAERGVVELDAPLPGQGFTLRQLLNHTAGLPDYATLPEYHRAVANGDAPWPKDRVFSAAMAQGLLFPPGAGWSYSNIGYMLALDLIEAASGRSFAQLLAHLTRDIPGLDGITLATTKAQFARVPWSGAPSYDPGWVYHGCLIGTAADAARLLHALFAGRLVGTETLRQMLVRQPLGGTIPGRPWTECGYALGLMSGRFGAAGRAVGHTGGGPLGACAVYHFPDQDPPATVASFAEGRDEGAAEWAAAGLARDG